MLARLVFAWPRTAGLAGRPQHDRPVDQFGFEPVATVQAKLSAKDGRQGNPPLVVEFDRRHGWSFRIAADAKDNSTCVEQLRMLPILLRAAPLAIGQRQEICRSPFVDYCPALQRTVGPPASGAKTAGQHSVFLRPEVLEPVGSEFGVAGGVLDVAVPEPIPGSPGCPCLPLARAKPQACRSMFRLTSKVSDLLVPGNMGAWHEVHDRLNRLVGGWAAPSSLGEDASKGGQVPGPTTAASGYARDRVKGQALLAITARYHRLSTILSRP